MEEEFNARFFEASKQWYPRIFRIGYQLVRSPVPGHSKDEPNYNFVGVGAEELKSHIRSFYNVPPEIKGVHVVGLYPGSQAAALDLGRGDLILSMDGKKVKSLGKFYKRIRKAKNDLIDAEVWRRGETLHVSLPVEKVYYNAQFLLNPTPNFDASASISKINVAIGAIRYARNDDELAVIMGHELAHVSLKHSHKNLGIGVGTTILATGTAAVIDYFTVPGVGNLIVSPVEKASSAAISRRYEREADYYGMQHSFHSGYDVTNGAQIFARLATDSPNFAILSYTFASHPKTTERFLRLEKIIDEFKMTYPHKFPEQSSPDWDILVPMKPGETLNDAIQSLLKEKAELPSSVAQVVTEGGAYE